MTIKAITFENQTVLSSHLQGEDNNVFIRIQAFISNQAENVQEVRAVRWIDKKIVLIRSNGTKIGKPIAVSEELAKELDQFEATLRTHSKVLTKGSEILATSIDNASQVRNMLTFAIGMTPGVMVAGIAAGAMAVLAGTSISYRGITQLQKSYKIGDEEGEWLAGFFTGIGVSYGGLGAASMVSLISTFKGIAGAAAQAGLAASGIGLAMQGFAFARGAYGLAITEGFREELDDKLNKGNLHQAVTWMHQQIFPKGQDSEIDLKQEAAFGRRAGQEALKMLKECDLTQLTETQQKEILRAAYKGNYREKIRYIFLLAIAFVSIAAFLTGMLLTGGTTNLLFMIGAVLWLAIDSSHLDNRLGEWLWSQRKHAILPDLLKNDVEKAIPTGFFDKPTAKFAAQVAVGAITAPIWATPAAIYYILREFLKKEAENKTNHTTIEEGIEEVPTRD